MYHISLPPCKFPPAKCFALKNYQNTITFAMHYLADLRASVLVVLLSRLSYDDSLPKKM